MAMPAPRSSVFTFESVVHSSHVLRRLDEQRCRDCLCDITVVVEGRGFRAHRSVLASCSEYFSQRISSLTQHGAVVSLPPEVTVVGFEPLLKFAYTSKLHFVKDNVLDVQNAVSILGFTDLDEACFDFLLPKFLSTTRGSAPFLRKTCCESNCRKRLSKENCDTDSDKEIKPVAESSPQQEAALDGQKSVVSQIRNQSIEGSVAPAVEETKTKFMQCPKYRKFQLACGKETCVTEKSPSNQVVSRSNEFCSSANSKQESVVGSPGNSTSVTCTKAGVFKEETFENDGKWDENGIRKLEGNMEHTSGISSSQAVCSKPNTSSELMWRHCPLRVLEHRAVVSSQDLGVLEPGSVHENRQVENKGKQENITCGDGGKPGQREVTLTDNARTSALEKETAGQLGPDEGPSQFTLKNPEGGPSAEAGVGCLEWQKARQNLSCPFLEDVDCPWKPPGMSECEGASQSGVSSVNSGEDGDSETETEGDSETTRERARQIQLPFPVDWIVTLSRNDFQTLLKQHVFTQEQLDFVHDMRRRSKNRLAAQRCRKRKLDCIYNLQCEISKLKTEREKLMMERSQLSQLKLNTCHGVTTLCQRVCSEANLQPEQLQVFAKYTSSDCPLSSFFPHTDALLAQQRLQVHLQDSPSDHTGGLDTPVSLLDRTGGLDTSVTSEDEISGSSRDKITGQYSL